MIKGTATFFLVFLCILSATLPPVNAGAADLTQIVIVMGRVVRDLNNQASTITTFLDDFFPLGIEIANLAADGVKPDPKKKTSQLGTLSAFLEGLETVVYEARRDVNGLGSPDLIAVSADELSNAERRCQAVKNLKENDRLLDSQLTQIKTAVLVTKDFQGKLRRLDVLNNNLGQAYDRALSRMFENYGGDIGDTLTLALFGEHFIGQWQTFNLDNVDKIKEIQNDLDAMQRRLQEVETETERNVANYKANLKAWLAVLGDPCAVCQVRYTDTYGASGTYSGDCQNGQPHGSGGVAYDDGSQFQGQFQNGRKNGQGTFVFSGGDRHHGEFRNDRRHGQGTYVFADGGRYQGEYRNGRAEGHGTRVWPDGSRYQGEFRNDLRHGQGTIVWADGYRYQGEFRNDKKHGQGILYEPDGERQVGYFQEDVLWNGWFYGRDRPCEVRNHQPVERGCLTWGPLSR